MDVLGDRLQLLVGEATEGVLHHLEVVVEVTGAVVLGQRGEKGRVAVGAHELTGLVERTGLDTPLALASVELGHELADRVGHEGTGEPILDLTLRSVPEEPPAGLDGGGGVSHVIGQHLVLVDSVLGQSGDGGIDDTLGRIDGSGRLEEGVGHPRRLPPGNTLLPSDQRRCLEAQGPIGTRRI